MSSLDADIVAGVHSFARGLHAFGMVQYDSLIASPVLLCLPTAFTILTFVSPLTLHHLRAHDCTSVNPRTVCWASVGIWVSGKWSTQTRVKMTGVIVSLGLRTGTLALLVHILGGVFVESRRERL